MVSEMVAMRVEWWVDLKDAMRVELMELRKAVKMVLIKAV